MTNCFLGLKKDQCTNQKQHTATGYAAMTIVNSQIALHPHYEYYRSQTDAPTIPSTLFLTVGSSITALTRHSDQSIGRRIQRDVVRVLDRTTCVTAKVVQNLDRQRFYDSSLEETNRIEGC